MENSKSPKETEEQRQSERTSIKEQRQNTVDLTSFNELILEMRLRNKIFAYFGTLLRRAKSTELYVLEDTLREALTYDEYCELFPYDLLVVGKLWNIPDSPDIFLVVEIKSVIGQTDVSRAARRANLLRKAGVHAVPVVTGKEVTQDADKAIREQNVVLLQNERVLFWKEAVANWVDIQLSDD